jgi:transcriptional regulator with GAF, ATPase, and Fis domain
LARPPNHLPTGDATASLVHSSADLALVITTRSGVIRAPLPDQKSIRVGRSEECDVIVPDPSVSRVHAIITRSPWTIEDVGSRHGTTLLGQRLAPGERAPLPLGAAVEVGQATLVLVRAAAPAAPAPPGDDLVLASPAMRELHASLATIATGPLSVLILGETGTGKEVFARAVHALSPRADRAFIPVNCAALAEALLENELFGHERGAFTGATNRKAGLFEAADGGTLFLDEVGDLAPATQSKLLRVLESGEIMRLGSVRPVHVDVRVVAATNRDVNDLVAAQKFRADLYYRLNGYTLNLIPLRERPEDLVALTKVFARRAADHLGRAAPIFTADALAAMAAYRWPGNVRELRHVVERAVAMCGTRAVVSAEHLMLPAGPPPSASITVPPQALPERERILEALRTTNGNQTEAAKVLGISRQTLNKKLAVLGVGRPRTPR